MSTAGEGTAMHGVEGPKLSNSAARFDFERFRLRTLVEELVKKDEVDIRDTATDLARPRDMSTAYRTSARSAPTCVLG